MSFYKNEEGYLMCLKDTLNNGEKREGRNGNVISQFGTMISFDNIDTLFPFLTTKKVFMRGVIEELFWFLRGSTDVKELQEKNIHIWDGNSSREYLDSIGLNHYEEGKLGPVYGHQWRCFNGTYPDKNNGIDQIRYVLEELSTNSRRAILSAWNPSQLKDMALPPCHLLYNFYKDNNGLSCMMTMRSSDLFLGLPFNIASTALLTHIIAKVLHIKPYKINISSCDAHIYEEHIEAVIIQLNRTPYKLPKINIKSIPPKLEEGIDEKIKWIEGLKYDDIEIIEYKSHEPIKAIMK